jgi:hypothetical protein
MAKVNFQVYADYRGGGKYKDPAQRRIKQRPLKKRIKLQPSTKGFAS